MTSAATALRIAGDMVALGKLSEAREVLAPIVAAPDPPPAVLWLAGRIAGLSSQPAAAIALLERAIALAPKAAPIYEDLAFAWGAAGATARASEVLRAGIATVGPDPRLVATAAVYDLERLDRDAARARLADPAARAIYPRVRALLAIHEGDWAAARDASAEAFELPPLDLPPSPPMTPPRYAPPPPASGRARPKPTIATTLSPRGGALQRAALATWRGFVAELISVNTAAEIALLQPDHPDVRFVEARRDGAEMVGKPLVFLDDILDALAATGAEHCGIVNGDIRLIDADRLAADLAAAGPEALTACHRIDVDTAQSHDGELYTTGFDAFFFSTARIDRFRGSRLLLGAPWWDYLLPALAVVDDIPMAIPTHATIAHVRHAIQWSTVSYLVTGQLWLDRVRAAAAAAPGDVATEFIGPFLDQYVQANPWIEAPLSDDPDAIERQKLSLHQLVTTINHLLRTQSRPVGAA